MVKRLLNEKEVSKMLDINIQTLRNHRHKRRGIPYIKIGRSVRYDLEDIENYIKERKITFQND